MRNSFLIPTVATKCSLRNLFATYRRFRTIAKEFIFDLQLESFILLLQYV